MPGIYSNSELAREMNMTMRGVMNLIAGISLEELQAATGCRVLIS
jgi:hypothetical protein